MGRKERLEALLEKVRAGELYDFTDFALLARHPLSGALRMEKAGLAYRGHLDAAKALHDAVFPDWSYLLGHVKTGKPAAIIYCDYESDLNEDCYIESETPARAWLIAIIKAFIEQEHGQ